MRNLLTIGIIALAAFAIISCDVLEAPGTEAPVVINENGQTLVMLNLGVSNGNARALHNALAQAGADFYEVVFDNDGSIFRTSWREGGTARLAVTAGTYDNSDKLHAYIFAGRFSDKTLLAVGSLSSVVNNGVTVTNKEITNTTTGVNFVLNALETNVNHVTASTLVNTDETFAALATQWDIERVTIDGKANVPVFMIPATGSTYATFGYTLSGITDYGAGTPGLALRNAIRVDGAGVIEAKPYMLEGSEVGQWGTGGGVAISAITLPAPLPVALPITINSGSTAGVGLFRVYFSVPVFLYDKGVATEGSAATIWNYRGGLNNALVDLGYDNLSLGGAFLIGVGEAFGTGGEGSITIGGGF